MCVCVGSNSCFLSSHRSGLRGGYLVLLHQWRGETLSAGQLLCFEVSITLCLFAGAARAAAAMEEVDAEPWFSQSAQTPSQLSQPQRVSSHTGLPAALHSRQPGHHSTHQRCCERVTEFIHSVLVEGQNTAQMRVYSDGLLIVTYINLIPHIYIYVNSCTVLGIFIKEVSCTYIYIWNIWKIPKHLFVFVSIYLLTTGGKSALVYSTLQWHIA